MSRLVLITGGSRGIGAATALLAARDGYAVAVNYTANSLAADEVVRQIRSGGGQAMAVQADVAVEAEVLAMFDKVDAKFGPLTYTSTGVGEPKLMTSLTMSAGSNENRSSGKRWARIFRSSSLARSVSTPLPGLSAIRSRPSSGPRDH